MLIAWAAPAAGSDDDDDDDDEVPHKIKYSTEKTNNYCTVPSGTTIDTGDECSVVLWEQ